MLNGFHDASEVLIQLALSDACVQKHGRNQIAIEAAGGFDAVERAAKSQNDSRAFNQGVFVLRASAAHQSAVNIEQNKIFTIHTELSTMQ